jgi:predicted DNA-binding ribbon-helix-helix protein
MRPIKRSLTIAGHRTSISLEPLFWEALAEVAVAEQSTVAALVARIDEARAGADADDPGGLSGAVRVYVLRHFRKERNFVQG